MREIYVFYADVFLVKNVLMDLVALIGANYFLRRHRKKSYLAVAAVIASVGSLIMLLLVRDKYIYLIASHFLLNTGMVLIGFGKSSKKEFLENWIVTYLVVILLGGSFEWLTENRILTRGRLFFVAVGILGVYALLFYLMQRKDLNNQIFETSLMNYGKTIALKAYWDSGNQLRDPYTGQGICILSKECARILIDERKNHFRLVPYRSLGKSDGMIWVTDIEELHIWNGKQRVHRTHVAVGIAEEELMKNCEYELILHASFL